MNHVRRSMHTAVCNAKQSGPVLSPVAVEGHDQYECLEDARASWLLMGDESNLKVVLNSRSLSTPLIRKNKAANTLNDS